MSKTAHILAYDDHADGNTYLTADYTIDFTPTKDDLLNAFTIALNILAQHDNACIIDTDDYEKLPNRDFYTVAPYSINLGLGIYAHPKVERRKL